MVERVARLIRCNQPKVILQQRYSILDILNTGTVTTLYKAEDLQLGSRVVILKEIGKNNQNTQVALASIESDKREMLLLASLIHPNLPRIYDYFVENQRWYFVMDFLEGETLEAYLSRRKNRPLPVQEVLDVGLQLSSVFDYLHIHQPSLDLHNLTLRNIWRTPDGKLYLLEAGTTFSAPVMPASSSIYSLGKILRQLQTGKISVGSRLYLSLPKLRRQSSHPQSWQLNALIRRMARRNVSKRPYIMGIVRQELQQLTAQHIPQQKSTFSRRTLLKISGYTGLVAATGTLTWLLESFVLRGAHPDYSPNLGGTISTYDTGSGVLGVSWSPDGMRLVMGNVQGHVQAFDANAGLNGINFQAPGLSKQVEDVKWLPDGKAIAAGSDDSIVWNWNAATGKLQQTYHGHTGWVISLACSPDGKYIASGSFDKTVQVWEIATGRQVVLYSGHTDRICSVSWSPHGNYIASASYDTNVQIWDAATGRHVYTFPFHGSPVYTVAWSPNGKYIASGGMEATVQVWNAKV